MGVVTPNIGIYIPSAGETNYDAPFSAGMVNIDQHDHTGGPNKGVPIGTGGIADGSVTFAKLNLPASAPRQMFQSGAGITPVWSTSTWPATTTVNRILYSSATNVVAEIATANNGILVTSNAGIPSILAGPGTTGNILQSNAAAPPSYSTATYPSVATGTGTILRANGTNWVPSTATYPDTAGTAGNVLTSDGTNWVSVPGYSVNQQVRTSTNTYSVITTPSIPYDDTIPQITEGTQLFSLAITPTSATSILVFDVSIYMSMATSGRIGTFSLFQDATANAIFAIGKGNQGSDDDDNFTFRFYMTSGTTSPTTFTLRVGTDNSSNLYINGDGAGRKYGGVAISSMTITEYES